MRSVGVVRVRLKFYPPLANTRFHKFCKSFIEEDRTTYPTCALGTFLHGKWVEFLNFVRYKILGNVRKAT